MSDEFIGAAALVSRYAVGLVLLSAAIPKLGDPGELRRAIADYELLPSRLVPPLARWLPRIELACAAALLGGMATQVLGGIAASLLLLFALAVAVNLVRGRRIDCGCGGSMARKRIGWDVVAGDLLLAAAASLATIRDPGVLSAFAFSRSSANLGAADAVALLLVAISLVLGRLLFATARETWRAERRLRLLVGSSR